eukprot:comp15319_c0_seq1/m.12168 comp15319_c0_seq1/g.12168  ORF comp15319_c0_seq1/g.12168 comp15319_c0_seq1/m.12168 type:complete len:511 (-) comp15319_c0_seq1:597-2129(-)
MSHPTLLRPMARTTPFVVRLMNRRWKHKATNTAKVSDKWEAVIGLEIHAQIASKSKIFSGAAVSFAAPPNSQVSFVDAALPGTLPALNRRCVEAAVLTGLALKGNIARRSLFDRKHYFYFDLPAGYQITQQRVPIVSGGRINLRSQSSRTIRIARLHIEQDTGKSLHEGTKVYVDLNRAGTGLMEIVTEPDIRSGEEAAMFVRKLQGILQELGTCDGNMDEGSMRVDVNVSVRRPGEDYGVRVEVKNVNGTRHVKKAIDFEIERQVEVLQSGGTVDRETRWFVWQKGVTRSLRTKESEKDYRYMPEPDLPPLVLSEEYISKMAASLPELPEEKVARIAQKYGLAEKDCVVLVDHPGAISYFEQVASGRDAVQVAKWISTDLFGALNARDVTIDQCPVSPAVSGALLDLVQSGEISGKAGKQAFARLMNGDKRGPREIVTENNWLQLSNPVEIRRLCLLVIEEQPKMVEKLQKGNTRMQNTLVGEVIKKTKGSVNPNMAARIMAECLSGKT